MNLHNDKAIFAQYIEATTSYLGINEEAIVEKDYFVTLFLRNLVCLRPNIIFKGGTSLAKCYKLINRFSEDIDLDIHTESGKPTEGQRRALKSDILSVAQEIGLLQTNPEQVRSRREFNKYIFDYNPSFGHSGLNKSLIVETATMIKSFPTERMEAASFIHDYMLAQDFTDEIAKYKMQSFYVQVQAAQRTFIDKLFAIADYYMNSQSDGYSRHLYDVYKIFPHISFDDEFITLVDEVREARKHHKTCLSAKDGVNLPEVLEMLIAEDFYKADYKGITESLLFERASYNETIKTLKRIIEEML